MRALRGVAIGICSCMLVACSHESEGIPSLGDGGLVSGEPCSAPCFWNITPGSTSEEQALGILSRATDVRRCEQWEADQTGVQKGITCGDVGVYFEDGAVTAVAFEPSEPLTVGDLVGGYGHPDGVETTALGISMTPPLAMRLFYDDEGMVVWLPEQDAFDYSVAADTPIESVAYLRQSEYMRTKRGSEEWTGYGVY